jgi:hypothetical protein
MGRILWRSPHYLVTPEGLFTPDGRRLTGYTGLSVTRQLGSPGYLTIFTPWVAWCETDYSVSMGRLPLRDVALGPPQLPRSTLPGN